VLAFGPRGDINFGVNSEIGIDFRFKKALKVSKK